MRNLSPYRRAKAFHVFRYRFAPWLTGVIFSALLWGSIGYMLGGIQIAQVMADEIDQRFTCVARDAD